MSTIFIQCPPSSSHVHYLQALYIKVVLHSPCLGWSHGHVRCVWGEQTASYRVIVNTLYMLPAGPLQADFDQSQAEEDDLAFLSSQAYKGPASFVLAQSDTCPSGGSPGTPGLCFASPDTSVDGQSWPEDASTAYNTAAATGIFHCLWYSSIGLVLCK